MVLPLLLILLFSVKYTISNRLLVESDIRNYYTGSDGEFVYKNNYTLPIGYAINSSTAYDLVMAKNNNGIENQNLLIQSLTGISDVFEYTTSFPTEADCIITPSKSGHMYLSVANKSVDSVTVTINNTTTYTYNNIKSNNRILDIGYVHDTDTVEVTSDTGGMNLSVYTLDEDKFIRAYNKLNSESYQVENFSDTKFTGTHYCFPQTKQYYSLFHTMVAGLCILMARKLTLMPGKMHCYVLT